MKSTFKAVPKPLTHSGDQSLEKLFSILGQELRNLAAEKSILDHERANLDQDTLEIYCSLKKEVNFDCRLTMPSIFAGTAAGAYTGVVLVGGPVAGGALALVGGTLVTGLNFIRPYLHYSLLEYIGLPFDKGELLSPKGTYKVIEDKPAEGIFRVKFYGPLLTRSEPVLNILRQRRNMPKHQERIQEIDTSLRRLQENTISLQAKYERVQAKMNLQAAPLSPIAPQFEQIQSKPLVKIVPIGKVSQHNNRR